MFKLNRMFLLSIIVLSALFGIFIFVIHDNNPTQSYKVNKVVKEDKEFKEVNQIASNKRVEEPGNNSRTVLIKVDGKEKKITTEKLKTGEVLKEANIVLGRYDKVSPSVNEEAKDEIKVIRVAKETVIEKNYLAYNIEEKQSEVLYKGEKRIIQKGRKGLEKATYEVLIEDGKEIARNLLKKVLVKNPVKEIIAIGVRQTVSREGKDLKINKTLEMTATGYTHTGKKTYTGIWPSRGIVAVDPRTIPLGTRLYIDKYGYATAMDIGTGIKGNRIDLFFDKQEEALHWGSRKVQVFILPNE